MKKNKNDKIWRFFGNFHQNLQALDKKKGKKWHLCLNPQVIAKNGRIIFKNILVHVLDTLCLNLFKCFEKKQKWQNLAIFRKFSPKFTSAWKKKGKKWHLCLNPQVIAKNGRVIFKNILAHVLDTLCLNLFNFFEKKQKWQNLAIFWKFSPKFTSAWQKKG